MNSLLRHLTKFIETVLELYAPLPFEFTADMHTLNAYLRSYSDHQSTLLEAFVDKLSEKLHDKTRMCSKENHNEKLDSVLRHYNSCTFKYPELKLNLERQSTQQLTANYSLLPEKDSKPIYSQRNQHHQQAGIKSERHKFGGKQRNRLLEMEKEIDKENISLNFNIHPQNNLSFKSNRSEMELDFHRKKSADVSLKSKNQARMQSSESRTSNTASLKIKLKPKSNIDLMKIRIGVDEILSLFHSQGDQIAYQINNLISLEQDEVTA